MEDELKYNYDNLMEDIWIPHPMTPKELKEVLRINEEDRIKREEKRLINRIRNWFK